MTIVVAAYPGGLGVGSLVGGLIADRLGDRQAGRLFAFCNLGGGRLATPQAKDVLGVLAHARGHGRQPRAFAPRDFGVLTADPPERGEVFAPLLSALGDRVEARSDRTPRQHPAAPRGIKPAGPER